MFIDLIFIIPCGLIFVAAGFLLYKAPPKNINSFYGYRSAGAMENQEQWEFAQKYSSKELMKAGAIFTLIGIIGLFIDLGDITEVIIGLSLMFALLIIMTIRVERKIKSMKSNITANDNQHNTITTPINNDFKFNTILKNTATKRIANYQNKPTIIFLHDSLGCIKLWRDFPEKVGELTKCNVIVYDRQGYGESGPFTYTKRDNNYLEMEADILNELLNIWNIEQAILFGHSDGGSIALIAAAKYPTKIIGVITEGAHVLVEDITIEGVKEVEELYKTTNLKTKLERYHGDKTEEMFRMWAETWTSKEFRNWNIEHFLPLIKCPSFIIQGENDEFGTLDQVSKIVEQTSGESIAYIVEGAKHTPHKEKPDLIAERTAEFIHKIT